MENVFVVSRSLFDFPNKPKTLAREEWERYRATEEGKRWKTITDFGKVDHWTTFRGKRRPAACFLAVSNRLINRFLLFPVIYNAGEMVVGEGFGKARKGTPVPKYCLNSKGYMWDDFEEFILKDSVVRGELVRLGKQLKNVLQRRMERLSVFCDCGVHRVKISGRMMWTRHEPVGKCSTCGVAYFQKCAVCLKAFDRRGGAFSSTPLEFFSKKKGVWVICKKTTPTHYTSAQECSKATGIDEGVVRATRNNDDRVLEGHERGLKVRYALRRTEGQPEGTCMCTSGRRRFGFIK